MKKKTIIYLLLIFIICSLFCSCDLLLNSKSISTIYLDEIQKPMSEITPPEIKKRKWSILIYMAADNDLEASAIEDIYEMEVSKLDTEEVSIFILIDRSSSYDTSDGNWTGSRLYKLKTGRNRNCKTIISDEIPCEPLGLYKDSHTELDMASEYCLSKVLNFIKTQYPAQNLGLIMWGHGTGWRYGDDEKKKVKGFAFDDSTKSYMTLKQFGNSISTAMNNQKLDFVGLDTCFSGEIEVMYELRNKVKYAVGTEGLLLLSGWNYEKILNSFSSSFDKSPKRLVNICVEEFAREYDLSTCASIVGVDLSKMVDYFNQFDSVMKTAADEINSKLKRDTVFTKLFNTSNCETKSYSYGKKNSDVFLDIESTFTTFANIFPEHNSLLSKIKDFNEIADECVFNSWASDRIKGGLGVYFGTLTSGNLISKVHDSSYIKGAELEQIEFVKDSIGYVPGTLDKNSFIDKLFYANY